MCKDKSLASKAPIRAPSETPGDIYRIAGRRDIRVRLLEFSHYMRLWMLLLSHVWHKMRERMTKKRKVVGEKSALCDQVSLYIFYSCCRQMADVCVCVNRGSWVGGFIECKENVITWCVHILVNLDKLAYR